MLSSLLLSFREGLEAALIIGILLAQLVKIDRKELSKYVLLGALSGLIVSALGGYISFNALQGMEEANMELFEGWMRLLAAGLIAYFILWLHKSNNVSHHIQSKVENNSSIIGLFILSFLSVFREGLELVIFNLTQINEHASTIAIGSIMGAIIAIILAYAIFKTSVKLNLSYIFKILGLVLIFLGGEMFAEGLVKVINGGGEALEIGALLLFILPSLYIFFKRDIQKKFSK